MRLQSLYICLVILLFTLESCNEKCIDINPKIKNKYSDSLINYFYDVVYYGDLGLSSVTVAKWTDSVFVYLQDPKNFEIENAQHAIQTLNGLDIPIRYKITSDKKKAKIKVVYTDGHTQKRLAEVWINKFMGKITSAKIKVHYRQNDDVSRGIILEELIQSLGVLGDNYKYPRSIFYNEKFMYYPLMDVDRQVLELLYSADIPPGLSKCCFEKNFNDVLHLSMSRNVLLDLSNKNNISLSRAQEIIKSSLFEGDLALFSSPVRVYISPNFSSGQQMYIQQILRDLQNQNLSFEFTQEINGYHGIHFHPNKLANKKEVTKYNILFGKSLRPNRFRAEVIIPVKKDSIFSVALKSQIASSVIKCLGPSIPLTPVLNENFQVSAKNKEMVNFIYSKYIPIQSPLKNIN